MSNNLQMNPFSYKTLALLTTAAMLILHFAK
jgi:hypothetical protein